MINKRWDMLDQITNFMKENEEAWEVERNEKIKEANRELREWEKLKRFEKIELLRKKWKEKDEIEIPITEKKEEQKETWNVWRKEKRNDIEVEKRKEMENDDNTQITIVDDWKNDGEDNELIHILSNNETEEKTAHVITKQITNNKNNKDTIKIETTKQM